MAMKEQHLFGLDDGAAQVRPDCNRFYIFDKLLFLL
jgi:hypothetical protein